MASTCVLGPSQWTPLPFPLLFKHCAIQVHDDVQCIYLCTPYSISNIIPLSPFPCITHMFLLHLFSLYHLGVGHILLRDVSHSMISAADRYVFMSTHSLAITYRGDSGTSWGDLSSDGSSSWGNGRMALTRHTIFNYDRCS